MRVLMTADAVGGVWAYALELADALAVHEVEVTLAIMGPEPDLAQRAQLARSAAGAHIVPFALEWMDDPWEELEAAGEWLLQLADESGADVVHLNGYVHAAADWGRPVVVAGHSDVLSWHDAVRGRPAGPEWERYRSAVARGLRYADLLVAPTGAMLDELVRLYDPPCPRLVVPNGMRRQIRPRRKEPVVLAAGRLWDEAKNIAALDRVAPRLPWPVHVAGEGDPGANVRALGRLGRADLDEALASAAILAAPARYEPFGLVALEAARAGCALVLGDLPSQRELWGDAALFVDPGDDRDLERALRSLIDNPSRRSDYARRAHERSLVYSAERLALGYLGAYAQAGARLTARVA